MDKAEYLKSRVNDQINWMEGKSKYNQRQYKFLKTVELLAAAAIPFLAGFNHEDEMFPIITGLLGVLIVIVNGFQQLHKFHENWMGYRSAIEDLKREKFLFESAAEPYNDATAFEKFVQSTEAILANENRKWRSTWMNKSDESVG